MLFCFQAITIGQISEEQKAIDEIKERGIEEVEVKRRLLLKGIDLDQVNPNNPEEVIAAEKAFNEVLAEIDAERKASIEPLDTLPLTPQVEDVANGAETVEVKVDVVDDEQQDNAQKSKIFGQHIFKSKDASFFEKSSEINVPKSYTLGTGDIISVSIWGRSQLNESHEIKSDGSIALSNSTRIFLKGLSLEVAKEKLAKIYREYYVFRKGEFDVTISKARTINVNIVGEVENYGSFNLSGLNNIFNALITAGGPTNIGSVRNIQLIRPGEQVRIIDIYEYLLNPEFSTDLYLMENDIINVPVSGKLVEISGAVKRPFYYELRDGEHLKKLIDFAGGLKSNAIKRNVQIKRFLNDEELIEDINLQSLLNSSKSYTLYDGDIIKVESIPNAYHNFITITGAVDIPGRYSISSNTKISDILKKVKLDRNALSSLAYVKRKEDNLEKFRYFFVNLDNVKANINDIDNLILFPEDELIIYKKSRYTDAESFSVEGEVREPNSFSMDSNGSITVDQAIYLAGGLKDEATEFAYIKRYNEVGKLEYIRVDLNDKNNLPKMENKDILQIYSKTDFLDDSFVTIGGAVRNPGQFKYDESLRLKDLLTLSGGLKLESAPYRIDVYRLDFDDKKKSKTLAASVQIDKNFELFGEEEFTLNPYDQVFVRTAPEFEFQKVVTIQGEVQFAGSYALIQDNEKIVNILRRAGGLTDEAFSQGVTLYRNMDDAGYVIINLEKALKNNESSFNVILKDGDIINIPKSNDLVTIEGATRINELYNSDIVKQGKINVAFEKNKSATSYIRDYAGGIAENGDKGKITVTYATGEVKSSRRFLFWRSYPEIKPGSTIRIGAKEEKPVKEHSERESTDWGKLISDSIAQTTAILSLIILVQRID